MYMVLRKLKSSRIGPSLSICPLSTKAVLKEEQQDINDKLKEFEKYAKVTSKTRIKKPQKPPFVKNLLLGIFDTDILTYPELENEELNPLNRDVKSIEKFIQQSDIINDNKLTSRILRKLANEKLIGLQSTQLDGGKELTSREFARYCEVLSNLKTVNGIFNNESLGVHALVQFGTPYQKSKYLKQLMNGDSLSAFCIMEPLNLDLNSINRTAVLSDDRSYWTLNGKKNYIINGSSADLFIVLALTDLKCDASSRELKYTAFIVERDLGGINSQRLPLQVEDGLELSNVVFENVQISKDCVISEEGNGNAVLNAIMPNYRLSTSVKCCSILKKLIDNTANHFIHESKHPFSLYETDAVRCCIAQQAVSLYAIESMIYLTSGLIDTFNNQDVELESLITKVFASEQTVLNTVTCGDLIGAEILQKGHWCNQLHAEAMECSLANDANENLKLFIALLGVQHAGVALNEKIKKLRNPMFNALYILKHSWLRSRQEKDNPKLNLNLYYHLHPSLMHAAEALEYSVLRLEFATENLMTRHGQEVINQHMDLKRLSECMIDIYAMTACIGRASRSYCIGLRFAKLEISLAIAFCLEAKKRVQRHVEEIYLGHYFTNDNNYRDITKQVINSKGYYAVHPLTRNF